MSRKAFLGEVVPFGATVFREGHDLLGADLLLRAPDGTQSAHPLAMGAPGTDRWHTEVLVDQLGLYTWRVQAYSDDWATWLHAACSAAALRQLPSALVLSDAPGLVTHFV